jgi:hypothetical protein
MKFKQWFVEHEEDLLTRLVRMTPVEQARVDIGLHRDAVAGGRFGGQEGLLANDAHFKRRFIDLLEHRSQDPVREAGELTNLILRDQEVHRQYLKVPEAENTGSHRWHETWIQIYDGWLKELKKITDGHIY